MMRSSNFRIYEERIEERTEKEETEENAASDEDESLPKKSIEESYD
jgi:hypothetical protein